MLVFKIEHDVRAPLGPAKMPLYIHSTNERRMRRQLSVALSPSSSASSGWPVRRASTSLSPLCKPARWALTLSPALFPSAPDLSLSWRNAALMGGRRPCCRSRRRWLSFSRRLRPLAVPSNSSWPWKHYGSDHRLITILSHNSDIV